MAMEPYIENFGPFNKMYWVTGVPTLATEGPFQVGDWLINKAPTAGGAGVVLWVVTTAGTGATATFTAFTAA